MKKKKKKQENCIIEIFMSIIPGIEPAVNERIIHGI